MPTFLFRTYGNRAGRNFRFVRNFDHGFRIYIHLPFRRECAIWVR